MTDRFGRRQRPMGEDILEKPKTTKDKEQKTETRTEEDILGL